MIVILRLAVTTLIVVFVLSCYATNTDEFRDYVPLDWKLLYSIKGDLNADGKDDAVLLLERNDPANYKNNPNSGPPILNLNPRRLLILFKTSHGYKPVLSHDTFISSQDDEVAPCRSDPLKGISISKGRLIIQFENSHNCGSWEASSYTLIFRNENSEERFRLIGQEYSKKYNSDRTDYSWNYLTGKIKITEGLNVFGTSSPTVRWIKIENKVPFYLDKMVNNYESLVIPFEE